MHIERFLSSNSEYCYEYVLETTNIRTSILRVLYIQFYKHLAFKYEKLWHLMYTKVNLPYLGSFYIF